MTVSQARLQQLASRSDDEIDYSDIPELSDSFFENARLSAPVAKSQVTMRLDDDVLAWFKAQGKGYQTRMNAVLKAYMQSQKS